METPIARQTGRKVRPMRRAASLRIFRQDSGNVRRPPNDLALSGPVLTSERLPAGRARARRARRSRVRGGRSRRPLTGVGAGAQRGEHEQLARTDEGHELSELLADQAEAV